VALRSPIFRKLILSAFALIALTILILDFYLTRFTAGRQTLAVEEQLAGQARILAGELSSVERPQLEAWARQAGPRCATRWPAAGGWRSGAAPRSAASSATWRCPPPTAAGPATRCGWRFR
jgi:hypothetical protein